MKTLTKQGAIERIREIINLAQENIGTGISLSFYQLCDDFEKGAIRELMHLFDIKEEEL